MKRLAERMYRRALGEGQARKAAIFKNAVERLINDNDPAFFNALGRMNKLPPTIDEFLHSPEFLGSGTPNFLMEIWPEVKKDIITENPDLMIGEEPVNEIFLGGGTGTGGHAKGERVLMYDGKTKFVEEVNIGDRLIGPDSKERVVSQLARGTDRLVRVTPLRGGASFVVSGEHKLSLRRVRKTDDDPRAGNLMAFSPNELFASNRSTRHLHKLWRAGVEWANTADENLIPPYILGLWLGDGTSAQPAITTPDPEIVRAWEEYAHSMGHLVTVQRQLGNAASTYRIKGGQRNHNVFLKYLREVGVYRAKHIPHCYLTASRQERLELLAGLVDTDGHLSDGGFEIAQVREIMASGILFLARSLALRATVTDKFVKGVRYFRMFISGDTDLVPTRIARKRVLLSRHNRDPLVSGFKLARLRTGEYYGFVFSGDRLYLMEDFTVHRGGPVSRRRRSAGVASA